MNLIEGLGFERSTLKRFKDTSSTDETSRVVMEYVMKGWPSEKWQVDELAREYWSFREELKSDRLVVPRPLRGRSIE